MTYVKQIRTLNHVLLKLKKSNVKNVLIGVIYRAHTAIDNFVYDVDPILQTISKEKKKVI